MARCRRWISSSYSISLLPSSVCARTPSIPSLDTYLSIFSQPSELRRHHCLLRSLS
ncbi:hypothetical protein B0H12DRAFT_1120860 [Mycena haematopus]|nr:hypothetical protein B0H12DRAFT_1120860 [Mycena haematopus]